MYGKWACLWTTEDLHCTLDGVVKDHTGLDSHWIFLLVGLCFVLYSAVLLSCGYAANRGHGVRVVTVGGDLSRFDYSDDEEERQHRMDRARARRNRSRTRDESRRGFLD